MLEFLKGKNNTVYLSDLCLLGGFFVRGKLVEEHLLSRKYEGILLFDDRPYFVYIRYGFYSGAKITGIAVPSYPDVESAYKAGGDFSRIYKKYKNEDRNKVFSRRKVRNIYGFITQIISFAVFLLYLERVSLVVEMGMNPVSLILSVVYPLIIALCYYVRKQCL